ncbi:MAG TPA: hypothetical protein PK992_02630 [Planctomycetaceae bacterium]|nr:hypothetical protein [Planctomycetaceae bacterium]
MPTPPLGVVVKANGKDLSANNFANWAMPDSVLPPVKIPSAERRAYSTPVAPPTGKPSVAAERLSTVPFVVDATHEKRVVKSDGARRKHTAIVKER